MSDQAKHAPDTGCDDDKLPSSFVAEVRNVLDGSAKHAPERPEGLDEFLDCDICPHKWHGVTKVKLATYIRALEASAKETAAELERARQTIEATKEGLHGLIAAMDLERDYWAEERDRFREELERVTDKLRLELQAHHETAAELERYEAGCVQLRRQYALRLSELERVKADYKRALGLLTSSRPNSAEMLKTMEERDRLRETNRELVEDKARLEALLNTPEIQDFDKAVPLEAAHQVTRWGVKSDAGKMPADWFWLVGYLAGKALAAAISGNQEKAKHHCISTAAALRNWHAHMRSGTSAMRPGIEDPDSVRAKSQTSDRADQSQGAANSVRHEAQKAEVE